MNAEKKFWAITIGLILYGASIFVFAWNLIDGGSSLFTYILAGDLLVVGSIGLGYALSHED